MYVVWSTLYRSSAGQTRGGMRCSGEVGDGGGTPRPFVQGTREGVSKGLSIIVQR